MKITDTIRKVCDILNREFDLREQMFPFFRNAKDLGRVAIPRDIQNKLNLDVFDTLPMVSLDNMPMEDFKQDIGILAVTGGINSTGIVFKDFVIKFSPTEPTYGDHRASDNDTFFYESMVDKFGDLAERHLAATNTYGGFTIQETIRVASDVLRSMTTRKLNKVYRTLLDANNVLRVKDIHTGNWGFRGRDRDVPVIFDFSSYQDRRRKLTWYQLNMQSIWNDDNWGRERRKERALRQYWENLSPKNAEKY